MHIRYDEKEILKWYNLGLTDAEIAIKIGCTSNQMAKKRKRMGLEPNDPKKSYVPSNREMAIIVGTLLGDSCIRYVHNKCTYPMLNFSHCKKQEEYFNYKKDQLLMFMASCNCYSKKNYWNPEIRNDMFQFTGKNMNCLIPIREAFYKDNKKIIPVEYLSKYFTEESIYY